MISKEVVIIEEILKDKRKDKEVTFGELLEFFEEYDIKRKKMLYG